MKVRHFCEDPKVAVCGYALCVGDNFSRFYDETSNAFAAITCSGCRQWLHDNRLACAGFKDPEEWGSTAKRDP